MKTNQTFTMLTIAILVTLQFKNSTAGDGYIGFGGGYGIATSSQSLGVNGTSSDRELVKGTFGQGMNAGIILGTMVSSTVGLELGASYLFGSKVKTTYTSTSGYSSTSEISAQMLRLLPAIKITSASEKTKVYLKAGMAIGVAGNLDASEDENGSFNNNSLERTTRYSGGVAIGFTGAFGAEFKTGEHSAFFTEVNILTQSWAPSKGETTAYSINGQDQLSSLTKSQKEIEFESTIDINTAPDPLSPSKALKTYLPMSSVGINIGYRFMLIKKNKAGKSAS